MEQLIEIAERADWLGYFGSPRLASAEHGKQIWERGSAVAIDLALQILNGRDVREIPRFSDEMLKSPEDVRLDGASLEHEARWRQKQQEWLQQRRLP